MKTTLKTTISSIFKSRTASALMTAVAIVLSTQASAEVSQVPLSLSVGVPPNIIFTLDESGSMSWGYVPDAGTTTYNNLIGTRSTTSSKRFRAARTNPMAYNPNVIYQIPPAYNASRAPLTLSTSYTNAPTNGFDPDRKSYSGTRNNPHDTY